MELFFISFSLLLFFVSLSFTLISYKRKGGDTTAATKLPPGSYGWPFIGESLEFLYGNHEKFVGDRTRKHSPKIFKTTILGEPTAVICGHDGNKFLFSNEQKLVAVWRPHSMQKLFRSYKANVPAATPVAAQQRTEVSPMLRTSGFLKPEALMRYLGKMDLLTKQHLQIYWEGRDQVNVSPLSKKFTLTLAACYFLGLDDHDRVTKLVNKFDCMTAGLHSIPLNFPGTIFYRANKAAGEIRKELQLVIKEKKLVANSRGDSMHDVVSHMIVATDSNGRLLPEIEIVDRVMGYLVAGYSTVATAITFLMKYIGEQPQVYEKILSEQIEITKSKASGDALDWNDLQKMKYSWNVANEVMRLIPPLQGTFREALTDFTYAGFTIPKGWKIYWTVSSTSKNPKYFPEPEKFDPLRYEGNGTDPYAFVPFGGGPRMCPGKEYARVAILTFLHNAVKKFKWEVVFPNEKIIVGMMPTPAKGLPVRLGHH